MGSTENELRENLEMLLVAVDLERGQHERSEEVNAAIASASALLSTC